MSKTMNALRSEHRSIAFFLDLLEKQTALIEQSGETDLPLIIEIVDYFRNFPDMHHHPKEDMVLRHLRQRAEGLDADFFALEHAHETLSGELHAFSRTVAALLRDPSPGTRSDFLHAAKDFIAHEREHMDMEERYFFPAAERWLTDDDWTAIDKAAGEFVDPMTTPEAVQRFRRLSEQIERWQEQPEPAS